LRPSIPEGVEYSSDEEDDRKKKKKKPAESDDKNQIRLRNEYLMAHEVLLQTGKLPINFDQSCLSCQSGGRDTGLIMKMFKTACLSYAPTEVEYREHKLSRLTLIGMRRDLIDKMTDAI